MTGARFTAFQIPRTLMSTVKKSNYEIRLITRVSLIMITVSNLV